MSVAHVIGVDPGLVHTGVVSMVFHPDNTTITVEHSLVQGPDAQAVAAWIKGTFGPHPRIFVEQYKVRHNLSADTRMLQAETDLRRTLQGAKFLPNMGIRRVVQQQTMEVLGLWKWRSVSHHQDLRSAARIALLGMVKDEVLNDLLADVVRDHIEGRTWDVHHV